MINLIDKHAIIRLKLEGISNREISKKLGVNRKTVAKYWNEYEELQKELEIENIDARIVQEKIAQKPKYNSTNRKKVKYTKELDEYLDKIFESEKEKDLKLKNHKQSLSIVQTLDGHFFTQTKLLKFF
ncbi:helix-turn-helix domain-containing protein [Helcococcus ovis]|uniref:helix-turn-helix domain-containing protein n=1 Tax=Helcococcus ovis TaxID=72026 RepID=UPI00142F6965|nr:helix-turn-helix domain-containing protein [Helcococcus ovis]